MMAHNFRFYALLSILFATACKDKKVTTPAVTENHRIEVYDKEMLTIIDSNATIEVLADGFTWSEGPLWLDGEKKLIFTDVPQNKIYAWDSIHGKQEYLTPSGYTLAEKIGSEEGANGLTLDLDGHLLLCQHGNRKVAKMMAPLNAPKDSFLFLATEYKGKKFNSPNDLHVTKDGDIFFTDPPYGLPEQDKDSHKELSFNGVYRIKKDGTILLLDSTLTKPNGITFSPDEKFMYVANSDPEKALIRKYTLDDQKQIVSSSLFVDVTHLVPKLKGLPDGMKVNKNGYIFATGPGGVLVFSPDSRHLGTIMTDNATANCTLDKEQKYLYMTAHSFLMRVRLK